MFGYYMPNVQCACLRNHSRPFPFMVQASHATNQGWRGRISIKPLASTMAPTKSIMLFTTKY